MLMGRGFEGPPAQAGPGGWALFKSGVDAEDDHEE